MQTHTKYNEVYCSMLMINQKFQANEKKINNANRHHTQKNGSFIKYRYGIIQINRPTIRRTRTKKKKKIQNKIEMQTNKKKLLRFQILFHFLFTRTNSWDSTKYKYQKQVTRTQRLPFHCRCCCYICFMQKWIFINNITITC